MTPNPINAFKITIYNTKRTKNTRIHSKRYKMFKTFENTYFQTNQIQNDHRFMLIFKLIIYKLYILYTFMALFQYLRIRDGRRFKFNSMIQFSLRTPSAPLREGSRSHDIQTLDERYDERHGELYTYM